MHGAFWFLIGASTTVVVLAPIFFVLLRAAERRARAAEGEARQSQRLAELGSMTGGLAHEIKNPLSTVGLNAQLLIEDLQHAPLEPDERDRLVRRVETLRREVDRLAGILSDFLQFAGRIQLSTERRDLRPIIEEVGDFYHPQCDQSAVQMRVQLPDEPLNAMVDEDHFKQAMLNLMINAVQAMGREENSASEPELLITADHVGDDIHIHITDTGPGIPEDQLEEIFHPYVSHRAGGTGLGLPTTRRLIEEHGGRLTVASELGHGTKFTILLPTAEQ
ncbi:MAG: ATP-binding protein [Phycisphaerales bacterium]|jgi:signal transduction histidine kinase|nr:ATP-binding protein [Phycisphaerales bacterium]MDP7189407.1 ATP-binding protein [Phycisphaerales bacterium]|tara:strand:+ start:785 stop:1615 length:831 start_codon:yes stop_codon:yes gene_type:complete